MSLIGFYHSGRDAQQRSSPGCWEDVDRVCAIGQAVGDEAGGIVVGDLGVEHGRIAQLGGKCADVCRTGFCMEHWGCSVSAIVCLINPLGKYAQLLASIHLLILTSVCFLKMSHIQRRCSELIIELFNLQPLSLCCMQNSNETAKAESPEGKHYSLANRNGAPSRHKHIGHVERSPFR